MVPWHIMADGEISDLYFHDPEKPKVSQYHPQETKVCGDWIDPYFDIVNKFYNCIGSQLRVLEFQGPSCDLDRIWYQDGIDLSRFRMNFKETNHWYLLIHVACLGSLHSPHIKIDHLMFRDLPMNAVGDSKPYNDRLKYHRGCPKFKQMVEKQNESGVWPLADIRRFSVHINDHGKMYHGLYHIAFEKKKSYVRTYY